MGKMTEHGEVFEVKDGKFVGFGSDSQLATILVAAQKEFPGVPLEDLEVYCTEDLELYLAPKRRSK